MNCTENILIKGLKVEQNKKSIQNTHLSPLANEPVNQKTTQKNVKSNPVKKKANKKTDEAVSEDIPKQEPILTITCDQNLVVGKATITISFKAQVNQLEPKGIFHCRHANSDYITTHFEATYARTAFPCFDEFWHRATFSLSIQNIPATMKCISNTAVHSSRTSNNRTSYVFEKTPNMSPYLLAFSIGAYDVVCEDVVGANGDNTQVNIYYPSDQIGKVAETVMSVTKQALPLLEEYFNVTNEMKVDFVITPKLFGGGMENWGCIFLALPSQDKKEKGNKQQKKDDSFVELIIHELAHFWFGNLVAMPFHLKEGLAQYCEKKFGDVILGRAPTSSNTHSSFALSKQSALAVFDKNTKQEDFAQVFNGLTYSASLSLILSIVSEVGEENFQQKMRKMMDSYSYKYMNEQDFVELCT
ncbi:leucyl aminopeptidase [Acrasis kona]|uniref:Leucyl aminopeptidase n=1 Tax=Acrasis kona TaxID=1008807 RepID=A0AAW2YMU1_9EUKA